MITGSKAGRVIVALLLTTGISTARTLSPADTLGPTLRAGFAEGRFGSAIAVGDVDGDGHPDLVVGAPGTSTETGEALGGAVYVLDVSLDHEGLSPFARGEGPRDQLGAAVVVRDLDGDGIDDLIATAPGASPGERTAAGVVRVWLGPLRDADEAALVIEGERPGDRFGASALVVDVDGDGSAELLVAAPRGGAPDRIGFGTVSVIPWTALADLSGRVSAGEVAVVTIRGDEKGDALSALASGDIDGDGMAEIIVGAPHADGRDYDFVDAGKVGIFRLRGELPDTLLFSDAATLIHGAHARGFLGAALATGDVTGDGIDELVMGAPTAGEKGDGGEVSGHAFVLFGEPEGPPLEIFLAESDIPRAHSERWELFGAAVAADDVDGDRTADLLFGAPFLSCDGGDTRCGGVFIYRGSLRSVVAAKTGPADRADALLVGTLEDGAAGSAVIVADVTGDGRADLVVGAPEAPSPEGEPRAGAVYVIDAAALTR